MKQTENTIAYRLYKARKDKHLTQYQLAALCSISRQTIYEYEKGLYIPKLDNAGKLAEVLGVSLDYLCFGEKKVVIHSETFSHTYKELMKSYIHIKDSLNTSSYIENNKLHIIVEDPDFIKLYTHIENIYTIADSISEETYKSAINDLFKTFDYPIKK